MSTPRLCPHCNQVVAGRCKRCRNIRYGVVHQRERSAWEPIVAIGSTPCARGEWCGEPHLIDPKQPWHLDHIDDQRRPSCARHNDQFTGR